MSFQTDAAAEALVNLGWGPGITVAYTAAGGAEVPDVPASFTETAGTDQHVDVGTSYVRTGTLCVLSGGPMGGAQRGDTVTIRGERWAVGERVNSSGVLVMMEVKRETVKDASAKGALRKL